MCGICGIIYDDPSRPVGHGLLEVMTRTMIHRGPDDEGFFFGRASGLAIRRLSIIDIEGGHQPFASENGDIYAVCNGEIYNFRELRAELEKAGHIFRTRSDVEVLPHLYEEYGADLLKKLNGMFGLAVWNEKERALLIARDRLGEKPLYWTHLKGMFIFASELKAILAHPEISPPISSAALSKYLAYEYVPAPLTIFENIHKLEPGHCLTFKNGNVLVRPYWDILDRGETGGISAEESCREFTRLLERSVSRRLISDAPLGAFLSGGIDSSSIVAMMSKCGGRKNMETFSIAFGERSFDESRHAKIVADHFGTVHHEEKVTAEDLLECIPEVSGFLDEPLGDASIIPTFVLSRFARKNVTVALGGDGGDELFAGYPTFVAEKFVKVYEKLPEFLKRSIIEPGIRLLPASDRDISLDFKLKQFIKGAKIKNETRHMVWLGSFSPEEQKGLLTFDPPEDTFSEVFRILRAAKNFSAGNRLLCVYKNLYLAEDILTKVDRASMAASLEVRAPFLDHDLVEFVMRLPYEMKLNGLTTKYLLKKAMRTFLPKSILSRPKKGFSIPVAKWIKGPLKETFRDALDVERLKAEGIFRPGCVSALLKDHLSGRADNRKKLWTLFMFRQWIEKWG